MSMIYDGSTFHYLSEGDYDTYEEFVKDIAYYLELKGLFDVNYDSQHAKTFTDAYNLFSSDFDLHMSKYIKDTLKYLEIEKKFDLNIIFTKIYTIEVDETIEEMEAFAKNLSADAPISQWAAKKGYKVNYNYYSIHNMDTNEIELTFVVVMNVHKASI